MDFKVLFVVGVLASGMTEWIKKLLPAKVTERKPVMAAIAAVVAALSGLCYGLFAALTWPQIGIACVAEVALSQLCYTLLVSTFVALKEKLKAKVETPIDPDAAAEEIADKVVEGVIGAIEGTVKKETK